MKKVNGLTMALVVLMGCFLSSCASTQQYGHEKYRGFENTPHTQFDRHNVDPNMAMNMSPQQFDDYMNRLNQLEDYKSQMIRNNSAAARAEKQWVSSNSNQRDSFGYQVKKSMGRAFDDVIRGASRGLGNGLRKGLERR